MFDRADAMGGDSAPAPPSSRAGDSGRPESLMGVPGRLVGLIVRLRPVPMGVGGCEESRQPVGLADPSVGIVASLEGMKAELMV